MTMRAVRMRVRAGRLEPLDEMSLPEGTEVTVDIEVPDNAPQSVLEALRASAGAWSDEAHPDLQTREDVVKFVRGLRAGFERAL
jgi:predicted DNA-binding antitoxin AbrB/MazE fold protein